MSEKMPTSNSNAPEGWKDFREDFNADSNRPAPEGWGDFRDDPDLPKFNPDASSSTAKDNENKIIDSDAKFVSLSNENSLDRNPSDHISPLSESDTSEFDPEGQGTLDDGADISGPFDAEKSEAIEAELNHADGLSEIDDADFEALEATETADLKQAGEIQDYYDHNPSALEEDLNLKDKAS